MSKKQTSSHLKKPVFDRQDWYSLSLDTVRGWAIFLLLVALPILGLVGYKAMQRLSAERQAVVMMDEAEFLLGRVQTEAGGATTSETYTEAWANLQDARRYAAAGEHEAALVSARWSRNLFSTILDDLRNKAPAGEAQFVGVQGGVEFRRGDGPWQVARNRIVLRTGDYVKTAGAGSAEVEFSDGTSFRIRPETVVLISRSRSETGASTEEAVTLEYGWINLSTGARAGGVKTPEAEAKVAQGSQVELTYDRNRRVSRFTSFRGGMNIKTSVGTVRSLGSKEQFTMSAAGIGQTVKLPGAPTLTDPDPESLLNLELEQVKLRWEPVEGATRYALQICRDGHFVDNVIDVENRRGTTATVGLLHEGKFIWRVAAFSGQGYKGPWSDPQGFQVGAASESTDRRGAGAG